MALWAYDPFTHAGPQAQKGPGLGLTLYCCILKFLILFGQGALCCHLSLTLQIMQSVLFLELVNWWEKIGYGEN